MMDRVFATVPRAEVFAQTGIQMMPINTLYQLASLAQRQAPALQQATQFLTIPDLLVYWLTGVKANEYTNATTTQCFNVGTGQWATPLLEQIGIPTKIFGEVLQPGQIVGAYQGTPVVLSAHHDTASAVLGVPARTPNFAYLSSGTWSLLGLERPSPIITEAALAANVTNEGGYGSTIRLLKNVMGLWLLQQSKVTWEAQGERYDYSQLTNLAAQAEPFAALVDPDDASFLAPGDMPARIRAWCLAHNQPAPESIGAVARCIFESLALKYRHVLSLLTGLTGQSVEAIHIVGGGSQNALLCQMTADATGKVVYAGPTEATALGNALVQLLALGEIGSVAEGRALIGESFPLARYEPQSTAVWTAHYERIRPWLG
jgi:rhamnulokinase